MPWSAAKHCNRGHQPYRGRRCPLCADERRAAHEKQRPSSRQRGYTSAWEKASKAFLALPGNEWCVCGCGQPSDCVDHRIAHKGNSDLFWDQTNWQPMNRRCNSRKAVASEGGFGRRNHG